METPPEPRPASCSDPAALVSLSRTNPDPEDKEEWGAETVWLVPGEQISDAGSIEWEGQLNGDDADDVIVRFQDCGNYGECTRLVLAACGGGKFVTVLHDFAQGVAVSDERNPAGWRNLQVEGRNASMLNDYPYVGTYAFDGANGKYDSVASWHYEVRVEVDGESQECKGRAEVKRNDERVTWNVLGSSCYGELEGVDPLYEGGDFKRAELVRGSAGFAVLSKPTWVDACTAVVKSEAPASVELECVWTCRDEDTPCDARVTYRLIDRPAKN